MLLPILAWLTPSPSVTLFLIVTNHTLIPALVFSTALVTVDTLCILLVFIVTAPP